MKNVTAPRKVRSKSQGSSEYHSRRSYLIFVDFAVLQFGFALLLERDDNQGNENVHEEERKHDKVNDVENGHFDAKVLYWSLVIVGGGHRVLKDSVAEIREEKNHENAQKRNRKHAKCSNVQQLTVAILRQSVRRTASA